MVYILFMYRGYYPGGGERDIIEQFEKLEDAKKWISENITAGQNPFGKYLYLKEGYDYMVLYDTNIRRSVSIW